MHLNYGTNTELIRSWLVLVSFSFALVSISHVTDTRNDRHTDGVPQVHYFGQEGLHNVLVIDLLGPSLEDLFDMCGRKFSIKTVVMTAKQMVRLFQISSSLHSSVFRALIFRDEGVCS